MTKLIKFAKKGAKGLEVDVVAPILLGEGWYKLTKEQKDSYAKLYKANKEFFDSLAIDKWKENQNVTITPTEDIRKKVNVTFSTPTIKKEDVNMKKIEKKPKLKRKKAANNGWRARAMAEIQANMNYSLGNSFNYNVSDNTPVGKTLTKQVNLKRELMKKDETWGTELKGGKHFNFSEIPVYEIDELDKDGNLKVSETVSYKKKPEEKKGRT